MAKGKKLARKSFTAEEKEQALQMLEDGAVQREVIEKIGCSLASLQNWKMQSKKAKGEPASAPEVKATKKSAKKGGKKLRRKKKTAKKVIGNHQNTTGGSDAFIRDYWKGSKAVDILMSHPDSGAEIIKLVNEGLAHSYAKLGKD